MMNVLDQALLVATEAHEGQERKHTGTPYVFHPIRVQGMARAFGLGEAAEAAALLHDTVEDTELTLDEVREMFGGEVAEMVWGLTNWEARAGGPDATANRAERKRLDRVWLAGQSATVRNLKLLDAVDNMREWPSEDGFLVQMLSELKALRDAMDDGTLDAGVLALFDTTWAGRMS